MLARVASPMGERHAHCGCDMIHRLRCTHRRREKGRRSEPSITLGGDGAGTRQPTLDVPAAVAPPPGIRAPARATRARTVSFSPLRRVHDRVPEEGSGSDEETAPRIGQGDLGKSEVGTLLLARLRESVHAAETNTRKRHLKVLKHAGELARTIRGGQRRVAHNQLIVSPPHTPCTQHVSCRAKVRRIAQRCP